MLKVYSDKMLKVDIHQPLYYYYYYYYDYESYSLTKHIARRK